MIIMMTAPNALVGCAPGCLQARIAALLKEHPVVGQSFCRMLVAPFIHYLDSGKGRDGSFPVQAALANQRNT